MAYGGLSKGLGPEIGEAMKPVQNPKCDRGEIERQKKNARARAQLATDDPEVSDAKLTAVAEAFRELAENYIIEDEFDEDARVEKPAGESDPTSFSIVSNEGVFIVTVTRLR